MKHYNYNNFFQLTSFHHKYKNFQLTFFHHKKYCLIVFNLNLNMTQKFVLNDLNQISNHRELTIFFKNICGK